MTHMAVTRTAVELPPSSDGGTADLHHRCDLARRHARIGLRCKLRSAGGSWEPDGASMRGRSGPFAGSRALQQPLQVENPDTGQGAAGIGLAGVADPIVPAG